jgi:hypothetical protein
MGTLTELGEDAQRTRVAEIVPYIELFLAEYYPLVKKAFHTFRWREFSFDDRLHAAFRDMADHVAYPLTRECLPARRDAHLYRCFGLAEFLAVRVWLATIGSTLNSLAKQKRWLNRLKFLKFLRLLQPFDNDKEIFERAYEAHDRLGECECLPPPPGKALPDREELEQRARTLRERIQAVADAVNELDGWTVTNAPQEPVFAIVRSLVWSGIAAGVSCCLWKYAVLVLRKVWEIVVS